MSYNLDLVSRLEKRIVGSSTITESDINNTSNDNGQWGWCDFSDGNTKRRVKNESYRHNKPSVLLTERKERQIVEECYAYFVEKEFGVGAPVGKYGGKDRYFAGDKYNPEGNKQDDPKGMWNKFKSFLTSRLKKIADYIEDSNSFQSFIKNKNVNDIKSRIQQVGGKYSDAWNHAESPKKQMAKVIAADIGFASMATLITYAAFKGTQGLSDIIEQKFGKVAGIISKVIGLPLAGALSLIIWGSFFLYRDEMLGYVEKKYGDVKGKFSKDKDTAASSDKSM